jgi:hypothetical protein
MMSRGRPDDEPWRRCVRVGLGVRWLRHPVQYLLEVRLPVGEAGDARMRVLEPDLRERPRHVPKARQLEVDEQAAEPQHRTHLRIDGRQALDGDGEKIGVEADLLDRHVQAQGLPGELRHLVPGDPGQEKEADQRVGGHGDYSPKPPALEAELVAPAGRLAGR